MALYILQRPLHIEGPLRSLVPHFLDQPAGFLLESGMDARKLGRYSFLGGAPTALWTARRAPESKAGGSRDFELTLQRWRTPTGEAIADTRTWRGEPFTALRDIQTAYGADEATAAGEFPLQGGLVGFLGFEMGHAVEDLPACATDDLGLPDAAFLVTDEILAHDHLEDRTVLIVTGRGPDAAAAERDALRRAEALEARLREPLPSTGSENGAAPPAVGPARSVMDRQEYLAAVERCRQHILAGDVFEVCLTHRLEADLQGTAWNLYERLQAINPAPFASFLHFPGFEVVSASPERFLCLDARRRAESRPIKGTRPRGATPAEDARLRADLASSEKDRAENVMIVDLVRNDLGRVCEIGSVGVPELLVIEDYATVFQLVSTIAGTLCPELDAFDLVRAAFPGGSMTGAPKIAALEIIDGIEKVTRGVYSGAIGYFDRSGMMDLSIVIRTLVCKGGKAYVGVGGAVVVDSEPAAEYQETLDKARALLRALGAMGPDQVE